VDDHSLEPKNLPLQFDHVEPQGATAEGAKTTALPGPEAPATDLPCKVCKRTISDAYFEINGQVTCAPCRDRVSAQLEGKPPFDTVLRAAWYGTVAAAVGSTLFFVVAKITGYELGIIGIVVGVIVGMGVRKGAKGRGGPVFQALAMFLTYTAVVATYVPGLLEAIDARSSNQASATPAAEPGTPTAESAPAAPSRPRTLGVKVMVVIIVVAVAYAAPFLAGTKNIMGIIILGIAVYEAWKINKRLRLSVSGPHRLAAAARV
jgi:predicted secreted protein